jgi:hypothetical protein
MQDEKKSRFFSLRTVLLCKFFKYDFHNDLLEESKMKNLHEWYFGLCIEKSKGDCGVTRILYIMDR